MSSEARSYKHPERWAYQKMLHGKHVNTLHLVSMMNKHHKREREDLILQLCKASGRIAVSSGKLTQRQRLKYQENKFRDGGRVYYLFDKKYCPADIGLVVDLTSGEVVYQ